MASYQKGMPFSSQPARYMGALELFTTKWHPTSIDCELGRGPKKTTKRRNISMDYSGSCWQGGSGIINNPQTKAIENMVFWKRLHVNFFFKTFLSAYGMFLVYHHLQQHPFNSNKSNKI